MEQLALLFFLTFLIFFLLSILQISKEKTASKNLPPGPWRLPIIGNLHQIGSMPHKSFLHLSRKHGPIMLLYLGRIPTLVISSSKALQSIFKSHDIVFSGRPTLEAITKFTFNNSNISFSPYGDNWRKARKLCVCELLSPARVRSLKSIREDEIEKLLSGIDSELVNLSETVFGLSYNVLCRAVFGEVRGGFHGVMEEVQRVVAGFCVADLFPGWGWMDGVVGFWGKLEKNFGELNGFYEKVIEEHLDKGEEKRDGGEDLVDVLLRLHEEAHDEAFLSNMNHVKGIMGGKSLSLFSCFASLLAIYT